MHKNSSKEKRPKVYKHKQIDRNKDDNKQDVANYNNNEYILLFCYSKVTNCLSNLGKRTRSLTHLISI